jgi:hypothetical protein
MTTWQAVSGQSFWDVLMNTYGTVDEAMKLLQDNNFPNLDASPTTRQEFEWDDSLVSDQALNQLFAGTGVVYATDVSNYGNVFFVSQNGAPLVKAPPYIIPPAVPPNPNDLEMTLGTHFTSNADGTTVIAVTDENGNPITGCPIIQVELETKPLTPSQYVWNASTSILTLVGATVDNRQSLFILYTKTPS